MAKAKAEKEELANQNSTLTQEQIEIEKDFQSNRIDQFIKWYIDYYTNDNLKKLNFSCINSKNIVENKQVVKTNLYYLGNAYLEESNNYHNNSMLMVLKHSYNENGLLEKSTCSDFTVFWNWTNEAKIEIIIKLKNKDFSIKLTTNNKAYVTSYEKFDIGGVLIESGTYEYNENDYLVKVKTRYIEYIFQKIYKDLSREYIYDKNSNVINYKTTSNNGEYISEYTMEYDNQNRLKRIYTPKSYDNAHEVEKNFSYGNEYIEKFIDSTSDMVLEVKYADNSKKQKIYEKYRLKGYKREKTYSQNRIKLLYTRNLYDNNTTYEFKKEYTYSENHLEKLVKTEEFKDANGAYTKKEIITYTHLILVNENKLGSELYENIDFSQYIWAKEELVEGQLIVTKKCKRDYYYSLSGKWIYYDKELSIDSNL